MADDEHPGRAPDQRRHPRIEMPDGFRATIRDAAGQARDVTVRDMSAGGAGLVTDGAFENDAFVELHMEGMDTAIPGRVRRSFVEGIGMEFELGDPERQQEIEEELRKFRLAVAGKDH